MSLTTQQGQSAVAETRVETDDGQVFIPATQRPDGSWRKPRRVKTGYVPPEEVPKYESKGSKFIREKAELTYPIGLSQEAIQSHLQARSKLVDSAITGITGVPASSDAGGKKKRKKAPKSAFELQLDDSVPLSLKEQQKRDAAAPPPFAQSPPSSSADGEKRLRTLRKKLQDVHSLQSRIDSGELKNPERNQLDKIAKLGDIQREIDDIESALSTLAVGS